MVSLVVSVTYCLVITLFQIGPASELVRKRLRGMSASYNTTTRNPLVESFVRGKFINQLCFNFFSSSSSIVYYTEELMDWKKCV